MFKKWILPNSNLYFIKQKLQLLDFKVLKTEHNIKYGWQNKLK